MPLDDFAALPAADDAEVCPFIERFVGGERRVMSVAGAVGLVRAAGTSGPPRLLPVTAAHRSDLLTFAAASSSVSSTRAAPPCHGYREGSS